MIESLAIEGLGAIDRAEITLDAGLTVITGETGAGKTMLLTGLGLLLGARADAGLIRAGSDRARVEGIVRVLDADRRARIDRLLDEVGAEWDGDALIMARTVSSEGRGRAHLGGRTVPASALVAAGGALVAVHGQDDQHRLLQPAAQREALDRFAGPECTALLAEYAEAFAALHAAEARMRDLVEDTADRERECADLADLIALVDEVAPQPGEDRALADEAARLGSVEDLRAAADAALACLGADSGADSPGGGPDAGAVDALARSRAALDRIADRDPALAEVRDRLAEAQERAADVLVDLARYRADLDADPARLDFVETRRAALAALRRRLVTHPGAARIAAVAGGDLDLAEDWADVLRGVEAGRARLAEISGGTGTAEDLTAAVEAARTRVRELARRLGAVRSRAADRLAEAVSGELAALAMPQARFRVRVEERPPEAADRYGCDDIAFELAARPDSPFRPLGRGASGGERSRIMLAIEVVFARVDPVPTFVFDEVDAGVGGRAAVEVGRRLARLARSAQVLVVTHLAQVAAFADQHIVVRAPESGGITAADVVALTGAERSRELARMLAGLEESLSARDHAEELLGLAAEEARGSGGR